MGQTQFDFGEQAHPSAEPKARAHKRLPSLAQMAALLDASDAYRVLRRLQPLADHGPRPPGNDGTTTHVLLLDTETTGLSHASDHIIELALLLVQVDTGSGLPFGPVETFEGFEDPGIPIPEIAQRITGISDAMVAGQRLDETAVHALLARADLVVAHNAGFDRPFVEARFPAFADKPWACSFADIDWKALGAESAKLSALALERGWFYDAHRALTDCHALLQVLSQPLPDHSDTGLARLCRAASTPSYRLRATGAPFEAKDTLKQRAYRWDTDARVWWRQLPSAEALADELGWLQTEVYRGRPAQVSSERLDARQRYTPRAGVLALHHLPI